MYKSLSQHHHTYPPPSTFLLSPPSSQSPRVVSSSLLLLGLHILNQSSNDAFFSFPFPFQLFVFSGKVIAFLQKLECWLLGFSSFPKNDHGYGFSTPVMLDPQLHTQFP